MATLAALAVARDSVTANYNGQKVTLGYNPEHVTQPWIEQIKTLEARAQAGELSDEQAKEALVDLIADVLIDWSVFEDVAETIPVPVTRQTIAQTAISFQAEMLKQIALGWQAKNATAPTRRRSSKRSRRTTSPKAA